MLSDNSREGEDCKLPKGFDRFECEYEFFAPDQQRQHRLSLEEAGSVMESPLVSTLCSGGASGTDAVGDPLSALTQNPNMQGAQGALAALLNPQYAEPLWDEHPEDVSEHPFPRGDDPGDHQAGGRDDPEARRDHHSGMNVDAAKVP